MTRNTGTLFLAGALIGLSSVAFSNTDFATAAASAFTSSTYRALDLFHAVFNGVRSDYVEKPDERALIDGAIKGMLGSLDPYSSYLAPNDLKAKQAEIAGEVGSLGLEVTMADGVIKVISPIDDTPASHAGMLANDLIIKIDGDDVEGITLDEAVEKLGGAVQSSTTLTVMRKGNDKPFDVTLVREEMPVQSVKSREDGQVGYIRISQFNEKTAEGLKSAIDKIQAEIGKDRVQGYVLDLRNNPAGLIDQAVAISSDFLDGGEIVEIRGRQPDQARRFSATGGDLVAGKPVIVLVNGGSASDSEIVAGALQDHQRATIVGTKSFGKGTVQTIIPLGDKAVLRLTTGRYYTPSGRSIQTDGIAPDIVITENSPPELAKTQAPKIGVADSVHLTEGTPVDKRESESSGYIPPDPRDDAQLNYALDLLRGAQVNAAFPPDHSKGVPN